MIEFLCITIINPSFLFLTVVVGDWGNYSECSESCMPGTWTRTRGCFEEGTQIPAVGCVEDLVSLIRFVRPTLSLESTTKNFYHHTEGCSVLILFSLWCMVVRENDRHVQTREMA